MPELQLARRRVEPRLPAVQEHDSVSTAAPALCCRRLAQACFLARGGGSFMYLFVRSYCIATGRHMIFDDWWPLPPDTLNPKPSNSIPKP